MLLTGFYVMIVGMVVVLSFLTLMVVTMNVNAKVLCLLGKYFPEPEEEKGKLEKAIEQNDEIAVVLAAVQAYVKG